MNYYIENKDTTLAKLFLKNAGTINNDIFIIGSIEYTQNILITITNSIIIKNYTLYNEKFYHLSKEESTTHTGGELQYLNLVYNILNTGEYRQTRNSAVYSSFHNILTFDMSNGFPLLTTKKLYTKGIILETLMFLTGSTDAGKLSKNGVKIWNGNTSREFLDSVGLNKYEEGDMGPMYGFQFYHFGEEYKTCKDEYTSGFNQFEYIINLLITDKYSRRMIMTSFNPSQAKEGCLYPCHSLILQFYVEKNNVLNLLCYNRSQDVFLGVPWNIAYAGLLLHIICKYIHLKYGIIYTPGRLVLDMGDTHVYESHKDACIEQLIRTPNKFPKLSLNDFDTSGDFMGSMKLLTLDTFVISGYEYMDNIKADMIC
jgi:thymidylate synthase